MATRELTTRELADLWQVAPSSVRYRLAASGALEAGVRKVGSSWVVSAKAKRCAERWCREHARK